MVNIINIGPKEARVFELKLKHNPKSFARVHHPECGHCTAMKKEWDAFKKIMASQSKKDTDNVAIFDIHADALPEINTLTNTLQSVEGYPTLLGIKDDKVVQYNGKRNANDMINFCLQYLDLKKIMNPQFGGKKKSKKKYIKSRKSLKSKKSHKNRRINYKLKRHNKKSKKLKAIRR